LPEPDSIQGEPINMRGKICLGIFKLETVLKSLIFFTLGSKFLDFLSEGKAMLR